ncbi:MAG: nitrilase [Chloroflexi bacterium]|nr:MAG: nitrilase [Chloroflexota bacterium]
MADYREFTLAAIQAAPVFFDRDASTEKACALIEQAAERGATVAAFGETWLPGYPSFANYPRDPQWGKLAARYITNAVEIPSPTTDKLCAAARKAGLDVVIGVVERDAVSQGTAYCTLLFIGREGVILGRHRKLKPTRVERIMWGEGDGSSLRVYQRDYGRLSGLNCWEHNMVLPGYALMAQGAQVHVAAWPGGTGARHHFLSQAFASQGACYVVCVSGIERPEDHSDASRALAGNWDGLSCIIDPWGNIIAGPAEGETILTATGNSEAIATAKVVCDVAGHYSRPDVLQLRVNRSPSRRLCEVENLEA